MTMRWYQNAILLVLLTLSPDLIAADITNGASAPQHVDSPITGSYVFQIIASFSIVIFVILALAWMVKKSGRLGTSGNNVLKIVSSLSLGMREKVVVINYDGVNILIGVAPGHIRTLHVLEGVKPVEKKEEVTVDKEGFAGIISRFIKQSKI